MPRIGVLSVSFSKNNILKNELLSKFPDTHFNDAGVRMTEDDAIKALSDSEGAIIGLEPITRRVIDALPGIRIFSKYGVGLDNIDVDYAKKVGKSIGWVGGVNKRSVSELALTFLLGLSRNVFRSGFALKSGRWEKDGGHELSAKTIGIIGCGFVGEDLLALLAPFKCNLLVTDVLDRSEVCARTGARQVELSELLRLSDFVSIHVPLLDSTRRFMNRAKFDLMKPTAYLINTSRGEVVEESDLKKVLQEQRIAGAAIDVFHTEPPTDLELLGLNNLMVTPHIGGNAGEAVLAMGRSAISSLVDYFS